MNIKEVGMRYALLFLLFLLILSSTACDASWNLANRPGLRRDIQTLFKKNGVTIEDLRCNMIGTSRSATCEFRGTPEQVASLVRGLNLKAVETDGQLKEEWMVKIPEARLGCLACDSLKQVSQMKVYLSGRRSKELRLEGDIAFEYLVIFQDLESDRICVQVSYAYG
jgi:hypothetical protein